jgi:D-3-phosphoglycerate dehydrogenase
MSFQSVKGARTLVTDAVVEALVLDLLDWLDSGERTYQEVMDVWRMSCPRLPVWEEANDRGLLTNEYRGGRELVRVTASGHSLLARSGRSRQSRVLLISFVKTI